MSEFKPAEKLAYIAKHGISLTFYCKCGDTIGAGNCARCGRKNKAKKLKKIEKAKYLTGFNVSEYWRAIK